MKQINKNGLIEPKIGHTFDYEGMCFRCDATSEETTSCIICHLIELKICHRVACASWERGDGVHVHFRLIGKV